MKSQRCCELQFAELRGQIASKRWRQTSVWSGQVSYGIGNRMVWVIETGKRERKEDLEVSIDEAIDW